MDESSLGSISNEAPTLSICRVFRLTSFESLEEDNCLIMSDTGLYLLAHWFQMEMRKKSLKRRRRDTLVVGMWNFYFVQFFRISENNVIYTRGL